MKTAVRTYSCRVCSARVVQVGGRRRRFCDDCHRLLAGRFRRFRRGRRFVRRMDGVQGSR